MMLFQKLTAQQQSFFNDCIKSAFENSALAFAKFLNKEVKVNEFKVVTAPEENATVLSSDTIYILLSELKGALRGKCYLNFTEKYAKTLFAIALPPNYVSDNAMQKALLLELDNILTAAVVSILSNMLKINSYAYVPELFIGDDSDLDKFLSQDVIEENLLLQFKTGFSIEGQEIESEFIWVFDEALLQVVESQGLNN